MPSPQKAASEWEAVPISGPHGTDRGVRGFRAEPLNDEADRPPYDETISPSLKSWPCQVFRLCSVG